MPLSISSSEQRTKVAAGPSHDYYLMWSVLTIIALLGFCTVLELIVQFGFSHVSRLEARVARDDRAALAIRKSGTPTILFVGNSLLLEGIDYPRLRESLASQAHVVSFPIEQTQYLDWFYGLRRLFDEGSQPDLVILCISADHLASTSIRGDYSAYYLFRTVDIPQIGKEAHYDLTKTSNLLLARYRLSYAGRDSLRNFVLMRTDPAYAAMMQEFAVRSARPSDDELGHMEERHLIALRQLCESHGARFAFLLPPALGANEAEIVGAGARSHTELIIPVHVNEFGSDKFRDGFHLNAAGARIFTDKVLEFFKGRLAAQR